MKVINKLFLVALLLLTGCDKSINIHGAVVNNQNLPISGAKVWIVYENFSSEATTDSNGQFSITTLYVGHPTLTLLVSMPQKKLWIKNINLSNTVKPNVKVILEDGTQMSLVTSPE